MSWSWWWRSSWVCCWLLLLPLLTHAKTLVFHSADATITLQGQSTQRTPVSLPYLWDAQHRGQSGLAVFDMAFSLEVVPTEMYGLAIPKISNGYEVYLNGVLLDHFGDLSQHQLTDSKLPRWIAVRPDLLRKINQLRIVLRADAGRQGGLSEVTLGSQAVTEGIHQPLWRWRVLARLFVVVFSALIGMVGLVLWLTQPLLRSDGTWGRDPVYLYSALAEACWVFRVMDSLMESVPLPVPMAWWSVGSSVAVGAWGCLTVLFCVGVIAWRHPPRTRALRRYLLALLFAGLPAAIAGWVYGVPWVLTSWYAALALTFFLFAGYVLWHAVGRDAPKHSRILVAAILANVAVGVLDLYRLRIEPSTVGSTGLYFSSVLFGLVTALIVLTRFRAASAQVVELNASLERRVAQREAELALSYHRLAQSAQEQARSGERSRILRDMHDGVGSHISTAIRQLQSGKASDAEVLQTLRDSLDQLKLSIDAMHLPLGDITALLANLRYRLEPRLKACGVELEWAVDALVPLAWLDAGAMRQLQFMLFEAISNVMQHARASRLRIEAQQTPQCVRIGVVDNGVGFDAAQTPRRGLRLMQERAAAIGAQLQVHSRAGCTVLEILLRSGANSGGLP